MRTRNSNFPNNPNVTILRRQNRGRAPNIVEPELRTIAEVAPMAERTMEELLRALTEGYGEAIVLPEINADHFEIKTNRFLHIIREKLLELAKIPLNENCFAMLLKKLPEKLGDPGKFLIPCNFLGNRIGNPTPTSWSFYFPKFILEEIEAYLKDDSISPEIDHADCDPKEDICLIEKLLNNDPFQSSFRLTNKQSEGHQAKSSI
ncbi:hypothetical protein Tco_0730208 [Tanacetum coccineum]|uniref:Reverse transcriptase domain-containing protein n=1 Tax=Tanacetum coccineum TaxID=301880 RepID=A0ABQ4YS03_9ASTR